MADRVTAVIPARLGSRRFSGKVLYPYKGKPLLFYVWDEVRKASRIDRLVIATDSVEIMQVARSFGAEVIRTSVRHRTGTDRVGEAVGHLGGDIVVNIQADNIGIRASVLSRVIDRMKADKSISYATLVCPIATDAELFDPNLVKVVVSADGHALWFSRLPIPYLQGVSSSGRVGKFAFRGHIGIYFFRRRALEDFVSWGPSALEKAESLEQLRILENNRRIRVFKTRMRMTTVDTPQDMKKLKRILDS
ncbi:MAG: 3-deoxy-manno-octulosonate cytidylyltransferase [candidate division Zixibacteria bacterium]|nr:3-deoxy-manno-octulosonate cytidylyltransferase [candidate division Zixibacteria bacterium]